MQSWGITRSAPSQIADVTFSREISQSRGYRSSGALDRRIARCRHRQGPPQEPDSRVFERPLRRREGLAKIAFKAPSLRISPLLGPTVQGNIKGSTRMGPSKHKATSSADRDSRSAGLRRRLGAGLTGLSLAIACFLGLTASASAQGAVRSVHGDWQIRCDTPPGAQAEQCALIQSVVAEDRSNACLLY